MNKVIVEEAIDELETILDWVRWSISRFHEAELHFGHGTDNALDEAVSLILHSLSLPQHTSEQLFRTRLTRSERAKVADLIRRRVHQRVPAAYLTNQAWFCELPFYVDERVLIPRSPIGELITNKFAEIVTAPPAHILDLCTGSACIAIACAVAFPEASVDAIDISEGALEVAQINIESHHMENRVFPIQSNLYQGLAGQKYDLIVTNPPYVDADDIAAMPDEFNFEPEIGLAAGKDGLDLVHTILELAPSHMNPNAVLIVEVGNSLVHVNQQYPDLEKTWLQLANGGDGVFVVTREALVNYFH